MSTFDAKPPDKAVGRVTCRLSVSVEGGAAELSVLDAQFRTVKTAAATLTVDLPPGVYKLRASLGSGVSEQVVSLDGDEAVTLPAVRFASAALLDDTLEEDPAQAQSAMVTSAEPFFREVGAGSELYLFVRHPVSRLPNRGPLPNPAEGLTLLDAEGKDVLIDPQKDGPDDPNNGWSACRVRIAPGVYRLRVTDPDGQYAEQNVIVPAGSQLQVFLLTRPVGRDGGRRPDLSRAAVFCRKPGEAFRPGGRDFRLMEAARLELASGRRSIGDDQLLDLLDGRRTDPMLRLLGGHLFARRAIRDEEYDRLDAAIDGLRDRFGDGHPDVEALALKGVKTAGGVKPFDRPPMLAASWDAICQAAAEREELVPLDSPLGRIVMTIRPGGAWLTWTSPPADSERNAWNEAWQRLASSSLAGLIAERHDLPAAGANAALPAVVSPPTGMLDNLLASTPPAVRQATWETANAALGGVLNYAWSVWSWYAQEPPAAKPPAETTDWLALAAKSMRLPKSHVRHLVDTGLRDAGNRFGFTAPDLNSAINYVMNYFKPDDSGKTKG